MLADVDEPAGRTYRLLRETRMAAVVCELFGRDEPPAPRRCSPRGSRTSTRALVEGMRRGIEEPSTSRT